jgi:IS5 family transposase
VIRFIEPIREVAMSGKTQIGLVEALLDPKLGANRKLERLNGLLDWTPLEQVARQLRRSETGRPPYAALAMLKALYLQALYDLSDPGLEEALMDRLSFRRFCGFALDAGTPDETTICRFRALAGDLLLVAFAEINSQLDAKGLILRKGTLMDATLIASCDRPPSAEVGLGEGHAQEPDADWTRKEGKAFFGYKAHIGVDRGSGLIRRVILTSAKVYESQVAEHLICGDERAVYGDKAYEHKDRRARLKAAGIKDRIMHRRHKYLPALPHWQQRRNALIARHRAPVEAVFSAFKRLYGLNRARCRSLARNASRLIAIATVYNLRRAVHLGAT